MWVHVPTTTDETLHSSKATRVPFYPFKTTAISLLERRGFRLRNTGKTVGLALKKKQNVHVLFFLGFTGERDLSPLRGCALWKPHQHHPAAGSAQQALAQFFLCCPDSLDGGDRPFTEMGALPSLPWPGAGPGRGGPHHEPPAAPCLRTPGPGAGTAGLAPGGRAAGHTVRGPPPRLRPLGPGANQT